MKESLFRLADHFLPDGLTDPVSVQRHRAAVFQSWLGVFFTLVFGGLYALMGSPGSGAAILLITGGLLVTPSAVRRGFSRVQIGNLVIAMTWLATFIVASRSGGFSSPSLVWSFLLPLCTYSACNQRSAIVWSVLAAAQIGAFYVADVAGVRFAQDFGEGVLSVLRISGYLGVIMAVVAVLFVVESARVASVEALERANRLLERERLLGDMHDGLGSQLLGLIAQARLGNLDQRRLVAGLETCLDDLRLIVDSLDEQERSLDVALGELRSRISPRCEADGIELAWTISVGSQLIWTPDVILQILRSAQEMLSNAIRHSRTKRVELCLHSCADESGWIELVVRDHGVGIPPGGPTSLGRGLNSLRTRARRLGGRFALEGAGPGARACLRFPQPPTVGAAV